MKFLELTRSWYTTEMKGRILIVLTVLSYFVLISADLELVNDEDLEKLIATEKFVVVLFRSGMTY